MISECSEGTWGLQLHHSETKIINLTCLASFWPCKPLCNPPLHYHAVSDLATHVFMMFHINLDTGTEAHCQIWVNAGQNNVFTKLFLVELNTRILSVLVYSEVTLLIILFNNYKWNKQLSSCSTFYPVGAESSQKARQIPQSARSTSCPLWQEAQCFLNPSAALH